MELRCITSNLFIQKCVYKTQLKCQGQTQKEFKLCVHPDKKKKEKKKEDLQRIKSDSGDTAGPHVGRLVAGDMYNCR